MKLYLMNASRSAVECSKKENGGAVEMLQVSLDRSVAPILDEPTNTHPLHDLEPDSDERAKATGGIVFGEVVMMLVMAGVSVLMALLLFKAHGALVEIGNWGYLGIALSELGNSAVLLVPTPAPAYTFSMGAVLNPLMIGVIGGLAAAVGELVGYALGARGRTIAQRGWVFDRFRALSLRWGGAAILAFAVLPVPFDLAGVWAGAVGYPLWKFFATVAVGKIVKVTGVAMAGYYGFQLLTGS